MTNREGPNPGKQNDSLEEGREPDRDSADLLESDHDVEARDEDVSDTRSEDADSPTRFLDRRRPWLRPITSRDRRRRKAAVYWSGLYVLLMAGLTSVVAFVFVRGYLWLWPSPTNTGAGVMTQVVPWATVAVYVGFAAYVTRSAKRTLAYGLLLASPVVVVLFLNEATDVATWLVGWLPGGLQVYGLAALLPFVALVLLGRDFVRWQLWVEYPHDWCWECGAKIADEAWAFCPSCANDLQEQRSREAAESPTDTDDEASDAQRAVEEAAASD
jgi:hypothetical protein